MIDIFVGYAGLSISFAIFAALLLWVFIKADNISWGKKLLTVPLVLAYSIVLYYVPVNFMGYASPDILGLKQIIIVESYAVENDAIYFLIIDYNKENIKSFLPRPDDAAISGKPRLYKIVYNSNVHKELIRLREKKARDGRGMLVLSIEKLQGFTGLIPSESPFELIDPAEVLKKTEE